MTYSLAHLFCCAAHLSIPKKVFQTTVAALAVIAPLVAELAASPEAMAAEALGGWGPFKFGMTVDQASAIKGPTSASNYRIVSNAGASSLEFKGSIEELGTEFDAVDLIFDADKKLGSIEFRNHKKVSAEACEVSLHKLLAAAEAKYGSFVPLGNTHGALIRHVSGRKSEYVYFAGPGPFGTVTMMTAHRIVGSRSIIVLVNHVVVRNDEDCGMQLFLQGAQARRLPTPSSR